MEPLPGLGRRAERQRVEVGLIGDASVKARMSSTVPVLNAIYEEDFLGFSYGFRAGRGPHDALDALVVGISIKTGWSAS